MKTARIISAATAAVMLLSAAALPVSAAKDTANNGTSVSAKADTAKGYDYCMKAAGLRYDSGLAAKVEKYAEKKPKNNTTYGKSLTKKFISSYEKRVEAIRKGDRNAVKKGFTFAFADGENLYLTGYKNGICTDMYSIPSVSEITYVSKSSAVYAYPNTKTKKTVKMKKADYDTYLEDVLQAPDPGAKDTDKISSYRFKHNKETYTLEVIYDGGQAMGFLFDSKGNIAGGYDGGDFMAVRFSLSPADSLFKAPSSFKEPVTEPCGTTEKSVKK